MKITKLFIVFFVLTLISANTYSQNEPPKIYNPLADAKAEYSDAIKKAESEGKHVLIMIGGNWCPWCVKFYNFYTTNHQIDSIIKESYVVLKINYSKDNKNTELLKELEFPQRFGFPVFVVLNSKGERIHTQDSGYLEADNNYDQKKVFNFLKNWSPNALNPDNYNK